MNYIPIFTFLKLINNTLCLMGKHINFHISEGTGLPRKAGLCILRIAFPLFFIYALFIGRDLMAQDAGKPDLDAGQAGNILNVITITLAQPVVDSIHESGIEKFSFHPAKINVNGLESTDAEIKLHGSSSMIFRRKSFNIKLPYKLPFYNGKDTVYLRHIFAISLNMDRNYIRNEIALEVLSRIDIPVPEHFYARLDLNDSTEGIYMIFNPPAEFALRECNTRMVIRRGYNAAIDDFYTRHMTPYSEKLIKDRFTYIYAHLLPNYNGKALNKKLDHIIDMKSYYDWLAFNYLFQNGDYTDEVYFYWDLDKKKFNIVPWDLDDLLHLEPHEGEKRKEANIGDKLLFSSEDKLDRAIANTPVIYIEYLQEFNSILEKFSQEDLKEILEIVYRRVLPYFLDETLVEQSKYDKSGLTNLEKLNQDIGNIYHNISARMTELREGPLSITHR